MACLQPWRCKLALRHLAASLAMLAGCTAAEARPLSEVVRSAELRACIAPIHPSIAVAEPAGCRDDCTLSGPTSDSVLAFAATLGDAIKVRFVRVEWDEQFHNADGVTVRDASYTPSLLARKTCDLYPSKLTKNDWRLKKLDFVILFRSRIMVVVNKADAAQFRSVSDLAGRMAAAEKDTSFHTWLQAQNASRFASSPVTIELMPMMRGIEAVDRGLVDFTMMDSDAAIWSTRNQFTNSSVAFPVGEVDEIGWAFHKTDKELQAAVQGFFESQKGDSNSQLNRIWRRAFGLSLDRFEAIIKATE